MRKLASIQRVLELTPIEGADRIELAKVLGWNVIVEKGLYEVGGLCIYCEVDSLFPEKEEFEFLRSKNFRIKTMRMRGVISQGICFPLSILPKGEYVEDQEVTELIGITKYEPPTERESGGPNAGHRQSTFPTFLIKTDETRIQTIPTVLEKYKDVPFYLSEKLDGTSLTVYYNDGHFGVCSRNFELSEFPPPPKDYRKWYQKLTDFVKGIFGHKKEVKEPKRFERSVYWEMARTLDLEEKMKGLGKNICFQGEIMGSAIQGNKLKIDGKKVYWFNIYDIDTRKFYDYTEFVETMKALGLETCPILKTDFVLPETVQEVIDIATMKSTLNDKVWAEGIVFRPMKETFDPRLGRVSFKAINPEFLLKNPEA